MTKKQFQQFWAKNYSSSLPISYWFKHSLSTKWLRFHSLPGSKRYGETEQEWAILLQRQNDLLGEFLQPNDTVYIVINYIKETNVLFNEYQFNNIGVFVDRKNETVYQSFCAKAFWQYGALNNVLKAIANDEIMAYFIVPGNIVAPYDGGVDLIINSDFKKEELKNKYSKWLSAREDGM